MKKFLLPGFLALGLGFNAQTIVFQDNFDSYTDFAIANVGSWTLTDVDQLPTYGFQGITFTNSGAKKAFQVFNSTTTTPPATPSAESNWSARSGQKAMVAFASNATPWNNDWMITPNINIPTGGGAEVSFWAKGCDAEFGNEKFKVLVSTTGTATNNFTVISGSSAVSTPLDATYHEYKYDLSAYAGQNIHIAIQCVSEDQFGFMVDDFIVTSTVTPTSVPNCATLTAPANGNQAVPVNPPATLTWSSSSTDNPASSYDVYFGTTPNPTTLLGNYTSTTATTPTLTALTTYYWKVVPKNSLGSATGCTEFSFKTANANPPGCAAIISPANGATDIASPTTPLAWSAPTTGGTPTKYEIWWGTASGTLTKLGETANTSINVTNTTYNTTYYWKVVPINADGSASGCVENSFKTQANPYAPYCGPLTFNYVEPITKVSFGGMVNSSPAATTSPTHENFINKTVNLEKGQTYTMTLEGNTNGNYKARFVVFIDWNKDGVFDATTETYVVTSILENSTGADGKNATIDIAVPATALTGTTRMRIKKTFGANPFVDPCVPGTSFGQAEDYTVNIGNMAVSDISKVKATAYPNPVIDILKITTTSNVNNIKVYDMNGKLVKHQTSKSTDNEINMSKMTSGTYLAVIETENGTETIKVIKK